MIKVYCAFYESGFSGEGVEYMGTFESKEDGLDMLSDLRHNAGNPEGGFRSWLQPVSPYENREDAIFLPDLPKEPQNSDQKLKVNLVYFKRSGKYYSNGSFEVSAKCSLLDVWDAVERMKREGRLPDLVEGANEFFILVDVPGHPHNHPKFFT